MCAVFKACIVLEAENDSTDFKARLHLMDKTLEDLSPLVPAMRQYNSNKKDG